jgi:Protein of unknown function (DUF2783)
LKNVHLFKYETIKPSKAGDRMSNSLNLQPNFHEAGQRYFRDFTPGDDFYQMLIDTHRGLSDEQSQMVNAKLILLLSNHIGDMQVLRQAMTLARADVASSQPHA